MRTALATSLAALAMMIVGCETNTPNSAANQTDLQQRSKIALQEMTAQDPHLQQTLSNSYGYAIFAEVGQGAVGIGGASGHGVVYKDGQMVGTVTIGQVSAGPQIGGQSYSELIVFQNQKAMNRLMNDALEFGASASATVVKAGAAAETQFNNGVSVFVLPKGGLEVGANLSGQKFTFYASRGTETEGY